MDKLFLVSVQNKVLRGLAERPMTGSEGTGSGGADESCLAAEVGKYIADGEFFQVRGNVDDLKETKYIKQHKRITSMTRS